MAVRSNRWGEANHRAITQLHIDAGILSCLKFCRKDRELPYGKKTDTCLLT